MNIFKAFKTSATQNPSKIIPGDMRGMNKMALTSALGVDAARIQSKSVLFRQAPDMAFENVARLTFADLPDDAEFLGHAAASPAGVKLVFSKPEAETS